MHAIRRHPFFTAWAACCLVLIAVGVGWGLRLHKNLRHELAGVEKKTRQRAQWVQEVQPVDPVQESSLTDQPTATITPSVDEQAMIPRKPLDGFIAIAGAVEKMRLLAAGEHVTILPDESFGFSTYAHEGPPENSLAAVHQQLGLIQLLVGKLLAAHPDRLLAVRRERLHASGAEGSGESAADFFPMDRRLDLRVPGLIEGRAVRLEFTGQTPALRRFLQSLATAAEPLVVRSVEVEPSLEGGKHQGSGSKMSVVVLQAKATGGFTKRAEENRLPAVAMGTDDHYALFDSPLSRAQLTTVLPQVASGENLATQRVELLAVKQEPYRLQLVGYYGVADDYTATFVSPGSPVTLFAREGHRFESLGLVLKKFSVKKLATESSGFELTACALLWDERAQAQITLVSGVPLLTETSVALLRLGPSAGQLRELRTGDTFQEGAALCRIEHIQMNPAEVVIVRVLPGQALPEKQILKPAAPAPVAFSSAARSQ